MITMLLFSFPIIIFAEEITPLRILEKYKANRELLKNHITHSEEITETRDTAYGGSPEWKRILSEFRTDGKQIDSTTQMWRNLSGPDDQSSNEKPFIKNVIWDEQNWTEYLPNNKWAFISKREKHKNEYIYRAYSGSSLDGLFLGDDRPVEDILAEASNINFRPQMDSVNGINCYVIDADTTSGKYSLWIDPEHGYSIAKAKIHKSGDDILYGKPISKHEAPKIPKGVVVRVKVPGKIKDFTFSLDKVEFQKVSEGWVPVEAEYQFSTKYVDGRVIAEKKSHKRLQIDLDPNFKAIGAFVPNIPDNTNIAIEGVDGIGYRWLQGKPVPNIDKYFFEQLSDVSEQIKHGIKSEVVEPTNEKTETSSKEMPNAIGTQSETSNAKVDEQKNNPKHSLFLVFTFILGSVIIVGIGLSLIFYLLRRGNHA